jgi:hypothetical protein
MVTKIFFIFKYHYNERYGFWWFWWFR